MKLMVLLPVVLALFLYESIAAESDSSNEQILSYIVDARTQDVQLYWKDSQGGILGTFQKLKTLVEKQQASLVFAMNGGMFKADHSPLGLFIERQVVIEPLNTATGEGNFYLQPNGVFYITINHIAAICPSSKFVVHKNINYATQSGPMLVIDGKIHPAFKINSPNKCLRNGVGILPDGKIVFAISKNEINFYDFATYFKRLGCRNALYLDGVVSRVYWPEHNLTPADGSFGVLIGVSKPFKTSSSQ